MLVVGKGLRIGWKTSHRIRIGCKTSHKKGSYLGTLEVDTVSYDMAFYDIALYDMASYLLNVPISKHEYCIIFLLAKQQCLSFLLARFLPLSLLNYWIVVYRDQCPLLLTMVQSISKPLWMASHMVHGFISWVRNHNSFLIIFFH